MSKKPLIVHSQVVREEPHRCFFCARIASNSARGIFSFSGCASIHFASASYFCGVHPPSNSPPFLPDLFSSKLKASSRLVNSAELIASSARIAGDENHAVRLRQHQIPGQDHGTPDPDRSIDRRQRHVRPRRRIIPAIKPIQVWRFPGFPPDRECPRRIRILHAYAQRCRCQDSSRSACLRRSCQSHRQRKRRPLQLIDRPAVVPAHAPFGFALGCNRLRHIRTQRHVLRRQRATGKRFVDVQSLPATIELAAGSPSRAGNPTHPRSRHPRRASSRSSASFGRPSGKRSPFQSEV